MSKTSNDDDTTANLGVYPDEGPKTGEWADTDKTLAEPTKEELEEGRRLGEAIDPDDDDSTGVN